MEERFFDIATKGGPAGALALFILGLMRKWWVLGSQFQAMQTDRDEWKALALEAAGLAEKAATAKRRA